MGFVRGQNNSKCCDWAPLTQTKQPNTTGLCYLHCSLLWNDASFPDWTLLPGTSAQRTVLWSHCGCWRKVRRKGHDTSHANSGVMKWMGKAGKTTGF